jgi:hypothetical protein
MKEFNKNTADNPGGIRNLWLVPSYCKISIGYPDTFGVSTISFNSSYIDEIVIAEYSQESIDVSEKGLSSEAGYSFDVSVSASFPKVSITSLELVNFIKNRKWIVIVEDFNGNFIMYGRNETPLVASNEKYHGRLIAELNHEIISFVGKTAKQCIFVYDPFSSI